MDVLLLHDVKNLGTKGSIVKVRDGHARNFLFPRKLGIESSPRNVERIEKQKRYNAQKQTEVKEKALTLSKKISGLSCTVKMPAGENDRLYGSVTTQNIQEALNQLGIHIDKHDVVIDEPIRKLGQATAKVKLHPEVEAILKVWVVKQ